MLWVGRCHDFSKEAHMNIEDIYKAGVALKTLLVTRGYTSGDVRIGISYIGFPLAIVIDPSPVRGSNIFTGPATTESLQNLLHQAEAWINSLPNADEVARTQFLQTLSGLKATAEKLGIALPVDLVA